MNLSTATLYREQVLFSIERITQTGSGAAQKSARASQPLASGADISSRAGHRCYTARPAAENEPLAFPSGHYDDQVDALLLFLEWFAANEESITVSLVAPIFISRAEIGLPPLIRDWSYRY